MMLAVIFASALALAAVAQPHRAQVLQCHVSRQPAGHPLGPRINAGGRVGESTLGVWLLTTEDPDEARAIAAQLSQLNEERRAIEAMVQEAAEAQVDAQHNRSVLVLAGRGWHPGVIGIVAGRIKEKTGKPTLVIGIDRAADIGKGSGRSQPGVNLGRGVQALAVQPRAQLGQGERAQHGQQANGGGARGTLASGPLAQGENGHA